MLWWERVLLAYSSGLLAAISPCVIVLVPLLLFRFLRDPAPGEASHFVRISYFALGFQASYLLFGYLLSALLTSSIQNGFKLGLGGLFFNVALLAFSGRLDPLNLKMFENTFAMGMSVALLMSFNPCTAPFLAVIISLNTHDALLSLFFFGGGLLTPSLMCVVLGKGVIRTIGRTSGPIMHKINHFMTFLLGASGLYLVHTIPVLKGKGDIWTALGFLWISSLFILHGYGLHDLDWRRETSGTKQLLARSNCCRCIRIDVKVSNSEVPRCSTAKVLLFLICGTSLILFGCSSQVHNENSHKAVNLMEAMMAKTNTSELQQIADPDHERAREEKRQLVISRLKLRAHTVLGHDTQQPPPPPQQQQQPQQPPPQQQQDDVQVSDATLEAEAHHGVEAMNGKESSVDPPRKDGRENGAENKGHADDGLSFQNKENTQRLRKEQIMSRITGPRGDPAGPVRHLLEEEGDDMLCIEIEPCWQCNLCMRLYMALSMLWGICCCLFATWWPEFLGVLEGDKLV